MKAAQHTQPRGWAAGSTQYHDAPPPLLPSTWMGVRVTMPEPRGREIPKMDSITLDLPLDWSPTTAILGSCGRAAGRAGGGDGLGPAGQDRRKPSPDSPACCKSFEHFLEVSALVQGRCKGSSCPPAATAPRRCRCLPPPSPGTHVDARLDAAE